MTTYAYNRVSTDQQADSGAGLDAQLDACRAYAAKNNTELAEVFVDAAVSGAATLDKRPGLLAALAIIAKGDLLVVAKRDRLGRDPIVVAMIEASIQRKGARIVSAAGEGTETDSPTDILMRRMVDAFGEYERLVIKARTKSALQAKKARNERVGHVPFGCRLDTDGMHLVSDQAEQDILATIRKLRADGMTLQHIAHEMNTRGAFNRGHKWNHVSVLDKLRRCA